MGKDDELLDAARNGNVAVVEKILGQRAKRSGPLASLRRGPGVNARDSSGFSCLHHAALNGHKEIVRLLLEHDAYTNITDGKGSTPLHLAAWSGNVEIVRLLLNAHITCDVNLKTKDDETALHCGAQYGHTMVVGMLLECGCDPGVRNIRGENALDLAAQYGRLETVELLVRMHPILIQQMVRVIPGTVFPHTPLHLASRNGHKMVVEVLLRSGLDANIRTPAGTALHEAALCGKIEVVRTLLEYGADVHIRDAHNYTVKDLLRQFPAHATQEIMALLKRHKKLRASHFADSDGEGFSQPFPPVTHLDSDLGSPYENVRPCSRGRSMTTDPSPGSSPHRWDFHRQARSVDCVEDRRISGTSMLRDFLYRSLPPIRRTRPQPKVHSMHELAASSTPSIADSITFSFSEQVHIEKKRRVSSISAYRKVSLDCSRESDNSLYQIHCAPKQFMDSSVHSDDIFMCNSRESDRISLSSTASSTTGYPRRPDSSGGAPLYMPMNMHNSNKGGGHSPCSNNKVSPTPPKKPPRRNLSVSPTHLQTITGGGDGYSNNAYEFLFLAHSGAKSQENLDELDHQQQLQEARRERLMHGRSVDQYVEMNTVFSINLDDDDSGGSPMPAGAKELQRGKSEDLDTRRHHHHHEPVAITYENLIKPNPKRKLRRNPDQFDRSQEIYEDYDLPPGGNTCSSSAPETTFVSSAFIMIKDDYDAPESKERTIKRVSQTIPLSPTHYQQPPTPEHPPPSALQAENAIHERIRPLSQEYKRRSKDMETETEDEYLLIFDGSSGSFSSSVSLSDKSTDNVVEEYHSDAPFAGLIKGSTQVLSNFNKQHCYQQQQQQQGMLERPKTLKKLKRVYDNSAAGCNGNNGRVDSKSGSNSSGSDKESENKENRAGQMQMRMDNESHDGEQRMSTLSPFDEQEEWAKIQEIMASFGTGIVRESVFVSELEMEFQNRLLSLSTSNHNLQQAASASAESNPNTLEKWLAAMDMADYLNLFIGYGFDDIDFLNGTLDEADLKEMGIVSETERQCILDACKLLPTKISEFQCDDAAPRKNCVAHWLRYIRLEQYAETFVKHLYTDMERIRRIWDVELSTVLDIEKVGHRKRMLASVNSGEHAAAAGPKLEEINADLSALKNNIQQLKSEMRSPSSSSATGAPAATTTPAMAPGNTGTIRHRHKKSRPAPPPPTQKPAGATPAATTASASVETTTVAAAPVEKKPQAEISVGGTGSIKAQWRHQPILLITGVVKYTVNYLGSTLVKEFKGTESTKKSIQKIRKAEEKNGQEIVLAISYKGLKYLKPDVQECICDHEIKNVNCACQDAESRLYFAYITKDQNEYYCHVFSTESSEQATDIILTLGQAFELAYQMALREQVTSRGKTATAASRDNHKMLLATSPGASTSPHQQSAHLQPAVAKESPATAMARADLRLNGHPLKMKPLTLSIAASPEPIIDSSGSTTTAAAATTQRTPTKVNYSDIEA